MPSGFLGMVRKVLKPWLVALLIVGAFFGLTAWQVWQTWFDHTLPPSAIQARELRVNSAQLKQLSKDLDSYHHPASAPTVSTNIFNPLLKS